jgi:hypothetical protein
MTPQPYISTSPLFRSLSPTEVCEFQNSAREAAIRAVAALSKEIYHPVYREEIVRCLLRLGGQTPNAELLAALRAMLDAFIHVPGDDAGNKVRTAIFEKCQNMRQACVTARAMIEKHG